MELFHTRLRFMRSYMKKISLILCAVFIFSTAAIAQVRPVEKSSEQTAPKPAAPPSFAAKYEGGMFGFSDREVGTLKFDDINERIVFYGKDQKEKFSISYQAMFIISPQSKSVTSTTGTVVSAIPLPGAGLAGLIREKRRYLVINYEDPDVDVKGVVNFKLDNKELLDSVLQTLAGKAELSPRGDAYFRKKEDSK